MKILDRYWSARLLASLLKTTVALVALFILIDLFTHRRGDITRHEVPLMVVLRYYLLFIPQILYRFQLGALAVLVSALLVFGDAAQNNEITAVLTGGVSLRRLVRMPVLIALGLSVALFAMQDTVGAYAAREVKNIESRFFSSSTQSRRAGISWAHLAGDWTCHLMKFNRKALTGENVFMHSIREDAIEQVQAKRIYWDETQRRWMLEDGLWFVFDPRKDWQGEVFRITQWPAPVVEPPEDLFALEEPAEVKNAATLLADIRRAERHGMPVAFQWTEYYAKFAQPALCFVMIWLAIPFALRVRRGGLAISFGVSVAIGLAYLIFFRITMGLGHLDRIPPVVAAWAANGVFLLIGLALFRKAEA